MSILLPTATTLSWWWNTSHKHWYFLNIFQNSCWLWFYWWYSRCNRISATTWSLV